MKIRHYAEIYYLNASVLECKKIEIEDNDIKNVEIPTLAVGVILYDFIEDEIVYQGEKIATKFQQLNTQKYYIGKFLALDDISKEYGKESFLYNDLVSKGCCGAVVSESGFCIGIDEKDKEFIIDPDTLETDEDERE